MGECKEKWQLCLIVSVHVLLWQPHPSADLRNPWNLTGAFFYYHWCWRILTWILLLWTQISFCCEVMNKLGEKIVQLRVYPRAFCLKSIYVFSSLLLTSDFAADDVCPIIMLCISFQKASCRMYCMRLSWCSFYIWEILQSSAQSLQVSQTSCVFSSLHSGRCRCSCMCPVAI